MDKMLKTKEMDSTLQKRPYVAPQMVVEEYGQQKAFLLACSGDDLVTCIDPKDED
jgi:hypothetical protein